MSFIYNGKIKSAKTDFFHLTRSKIVGANHDFALRKRIFPRTDIFVIVFGVQNFVWNSKLLRQLKAPLLSQRGGTHYDDFMFSGGPVLAHNKAGLDCFAQTYLVSHNQTFCKRRFESKQCRLYLVRIYINRCIQQRLRQTIQLTAKSFLRKQIGIVFGVVLCNHLSAPFDLSFNFNNIRNFAIEGNTNFHKHF